MTTNKPTYQLAKLISTDPCLNNEPVRVFDLNYTETQALVTFDKENVTFLWPRTQLRLAVPEKLTPAQMLTRELLVII